MSDWGAPKSAPLFGWEMKMSYRLRDDLSFCQVSGHYVFLDIENDRYFRLSNGMERAFIAYIESGGRGAVDVSDLVEHNVLTDAPASEASLADTFIENPVISAMEHAPSEKPFHATEILDVLLIVCSTRRQQKTRSLKCILTALAAYRQNTTSRRHSTSTEEEAMHLLDFASAFCRARLYVPVETCCLLDSISLIRFLCKRGMYANLVFGVADDPFAAHCWVQAGGLILNDTIGNANAHTAIRII